MARIFLSHSSRNNSEAMALGDWLTAEGWDDLFLDLDPSRGIAAGERWERKLHEAANRCEAILFLVSQAWLASDWCLREFRLAQKLNKRSFGILIEPIPLRDLPAELTANWQFVDLAQGSDHEMFRAVLPDGSESHVTFSTSGLKRLKTGLTRAGLDARFFQWPPEDDPDRPPYRGMRPLEAGDAGIFFGREAPTIEALDRLRGLSEAAAPRFMVILGASGAGKSSFLRAGLLPRLARDDRAFLPLPIVRPERAALTGETGLIRSLEAAVKVAGLRQSRAEVKAAVESGASAVTALLAALAEKIRAPAGDNETRPHPPRVVLAIDQAEELFLAEGAGEADAFLRLIRDLADDPASNLIVIATIRSDAYERLQTAPALEAIRPELVSLPPMPRGAYQTVIEGPAARLAETNRPLKVEPALTAALLHDVEQGGAKDALPLLAFTLERLYLEHGGDGDLRLSEYRQVGGIKGSIDAAVDAALRGADADAAVPRDRAVREALLRRALIPWLAGIDPETGSPRRRVARLSEIPDEACPLVAHLITARLLATDRNPDTGETTVEPAHEALLRQWSLLQRWLEEDYAALSTLESVKRAARDWEANARSPDWLAHTAGRLDDAEAVLGRDDLAASLDAGDRAYLAAARAADTARRDRELDEARKLAAVQKEAAAAARDAAEKQRTVARRTRLGLVAASLLAILAAGAAWYGIDQARRADAEALRANDQATIAEQQRDEAERQAALAEQERLRAEEQAAIAEVEKNRAEQNFAAAKEAVNRLIFDVAGGFRDVTGVRVETIGRILETVRATVEQLAETAPDDPGLKKSQVWMYVFFADTYLKAGAITEAFELADAGLAIARALAEADPGSAEAQRDLTVSLSKVGDIKMEAGDGAGALAPYEESLAMARTLAEADLGDTRAQHDLSLSLDRIGNAKAQAGDRVGAVAAYEASLAIRRTLTASDPSNTAVQRDLNVSLDKIGDLKLKAGDRVGALAAYEESLANARTLAEADPGDRQAQRDVSVGLSKVGDVKLVTGERAGALAAYEESLAIARTLAEADPGNAQAQSDLSASLNNVGDVKFLVGERAGALAAYEESLAITRTLAEADPGNAKAQRALSVSLENVGYLKLSARDVASALAAYEESLATRRALAEADPGSALAQRDLFVSLNNVGDVKLVGGDRADAVAAYEESLAIARILAEADPGNAQAQRDLAVSLSRVGNIKSEAGERAGALAAYEEGLAIARSLAEADPGNAQTQRDLSISLEKVGNVKLEAGDSAGALAAHEESLAIARSLAEADPDNVQAQRDLAKSLYKVGDTKRQLGDSDGVVAAYEEMLAIARSLAEADPGNVQAQHDLIVGLDHIGAAKRGGGDRAGGLVAYEESLAIARALAEADPGNAQAQSVLSATLNTVGEVKLGDGDHAGALAAYEEMLAIARPLVEADPGNAQMQRILIAALGGLAYVDLFEGGFAQAEAVSRESLSLAPEAIWLETNLAHALMLQEKLEEADRIYLGNRGMKLGEETWETVILADFEALRRGGISHPHMAEIEAIFSGQMSWREHPHRGHLGHDAGRLLSSPVPRFWAPTAMA